MQRIDSVDSYIDSSKKWEESLIKLRKIVLSAGLDETVKWGAPVYMFNKKNVVGIGAFKNFVSLWFFNGVFLIDEKKKLINAQEGTTKALRQWRFTDIEEIKKDAQLIKQYIFEAVEVEKQGKSIKPARNNSFEIPKELADLLEKNKKIKLAFEGFTKAKQKEFAVFISEAKREGTKLKRLEKVIHLILDGKSLYEKYKNC